jgi:hypothetical protein
LEAAATGTALGLATTQEDSPMYIGIGALLVILLIAVLLLRR